MRAVFFTAAGGIGFGLGGIAAGVVAIAAVGYAVGKGIAKVMELIDE